MLVRIHELVIYTHFGSQIAKIKKHLSLELWAYKQAVDFQQSLGQEQYATQILKQKIQLELFSSVTWFKRILPAPTRTHFTMCYIKPWVVNLRQFLYKFILSLRSDFLNAYSCQAGCKTLNAHWQRRQTAASSAHLTSPHGDCRLMKERDDKNIHTEHVSLHTLHVINSKKDR